MTSHASRRFEPISPDALLEKLNSKFEDSVAVIGNEVMVELEKNIRKISTNPDTYGIGSPLIVYDSLPGDVTFEAVVKAVIKRMRAVGYVVEYTIVPGTQHEPGSHIRITKVTI